jgi:hypothetical protein
MRKIVQDDLRQDHMIDLFKLRGVEDREGVDAYFNDFAFELKSSSKGSVSTARDLGYNHLNKWKSRYWLIGNFHNTTSGFTFDNFYLITPERMMPWYEKIKEKLDKDKLICDYVISVLKKQHVDHHVLVRTEKLMSDGILLNDPNIPKKYVEKYGILIDKDHADTLRFIMEREAIEADELEYTFS